MRKTTKLAAKKENPNIRLAEYAKEDPLNELARLFILEIVD